MQDKERIRKDLLTQRMKLAPEVTAARSRGMCDFLIIWLAAHPFPKIFLFQPFRNEPDLTSLISRTAASVHMPVVNSPTQMHFQKVDARTLYKPNKWGILEPVADRAMSPVLPDNGSLIVMPALAADKVGHRLGYGGGFYDRFLHKHDATLMVCIFDEFVVPTIPAEEHDVRVQYLLTESGILPVSSQA